MYRYLTIALLFVVAFKQSFSQVYKIIDTTKICCYYSYDFLEDSNSCGSLRNQQMILQIGSHLSKFSSRTQIIRDSVQVRPENIDKIRKANTLYSITSGDPINPFCQFSIFKNYPRNGNVTSWSLINKIKYCVDQPRIINWIVDDTTDSTILGYSCKRAFTRFAGRDYEAWFSTEIPINEGPYKFNGLPGLILAIKDKKAQHSFKLIKMEKPKYIQPIVFIESKSVTITPNELVKVFYANFNRLLTEIQNGKFKFDSEEHKAMSMQKMKSRNNFIEKY